MNLYYMVYTVVESYGLVSIPVTMYKQIHARSVSHAKHYADKMRQSNWTNVHVITESDYKRIKSLEEKKIL